MTRSLMILGALSLGATKATSTQPGQWFVRPDGSKQCEPATTRQIEDLRAELKRAQVNYKQTLNIHDGTLRMQVCGAPTGQLDAVLASPVHQAALKTLGFMRAPEGLEIVETKKE